MIPEIGARSFQPYPEYRDSGRVWLGRIPSHWQVLRNLGIFDDRNERGFPQLPVFSVTQQRGVIPQEEVSIKIVRPSENREGYKRIHPGDLVYNKMRMWQGAVGTADGIGIVSPAYVVCRPKQTIEAKFFEYLYRTPLFVTVSGRFSYGICDDMNSLRFADFKSIPSILPPLPEQRAIARFLDRETERIDRLIEKKQRLIELLEEKRRALITQAVTKGLDPSVPMKDSGVEWLGEIPAHWDVKNLSHVLARITYGFTNPMPDSNEGPFLLTANDIGDGEILYETARRTTETAFTRLLTDKSRPRAGDVLITKDGTLGRVAICDDRECCINQSVALLRRKHGVVDERFLMNALRSQTYQDRILFEAGGTTIKHIYISRLAKMPVAFPPMQEQEEISMKTELDQSYVLSLMSRVEDGVALLTEYRTALISAAVTGKIDVREET